MWTTIGQDRHASRQALAAAEEATRIRRTLAAASPERYATDLATSLDTLAAALAHAGEKTDTATALQEAVQLLLPLATSNPREILPDLVISLTSLSEQLSAQGRRPEVGRLLGQLLSEHGHSTWAAGTILLWRGAWSVQGGDVAGAMKDFVSAIGLLQDDLPAQARARRFLRGLRKGHPGRFDQAWDSTHGTLPAWLRHLEPAKAITDQVQRWIAFQRLDEEQALLASAPELVSEQAEAALDHLIDDNPGNQWLRVHRDLMLAARACGVEHAYVQHREFLWREGVSKALAAWAGAADEELHSMMAEEGVLLLSEEAAKQAENMLAGAVRTPGLIWRIGLLIMCRHDGPEAAFQTVDEQIRLPRWPGRRDLTDFEPRDLALARIRAGRDPDDPEAAFIHAVVALYAGYASEAEEAITHCAGNSPSWARRAAAAHLTELAAIRPDLAPGLARLRAIMADSLVHARAPGQGRQVTPGCRYTSPSHVGEVLRGGSTG